MANLHNTTASSISYTESSKLLTIKFKSKLRDLEELKNELLNLAAHAHDKGVKHVLIDNQQLKTPVGKEFQSWAHMNIELPLLNAGVEKIAFVMPKEKKTFALIHQNDTARKHYFVSLKAARVWLKD